MSNTWNWSDSHKIAQDISCDQTITQESIHQRIAHWCQALHAAAKSRLERRVSQCCLTRVY